MLKDYTPYTNKKVLAVAQRNNSTYLIRGILSECGSGTRPVDLTFQPAEMEIVNAGSIIHGDMVVRSSRIALSESDLVSLALLD